MNEPAQSHGSHAYRSREVSRGYVQRIGAAVIVDPPAGQGWLRRALFPAYSIGYARACPRH